MKKKLSTLGNFELMSTPAALVLTATTVFTTSVILAVMMVMVVAFGIGIISKVPCNKALYRFVCISVDTADSARIIPNERQKTDP